MMRLSNSSKFLLLAITVTRVVAQYTNQSSAFSLVLTSSNCTLNGSILSPCPIEGMSIEGLCTETAPTVDTSTAYFQFNGSEFSDDGILISQGYPMWLDISELTNVAVPLFIPDDYFTTILFDVEEKMNIQGYQRWYACVDHDVTGYDFQVLAWVIGSGVAENPTCVEVEVTRVFT